MELLNYFKFNTQALSFWKMMFISVSVLIVSIIVSGNIKHLIEFSTNTKEENAMVYKIIMLLIVAPIFEELAFRYPSDLKKKSIITATIFGILLFGLNFKSLINLEFSTVLIYPIVFAIFIYFILKKWLSSKIIDILNENRILFIYALIAIFALGHIKWELTIFTLLMTPLLLLPFFGIGVILTNFRLKYGLLASVFIHFTLNGLVFLA